MSKDEVDQILALTAWFKSQDIESPAAMSLMLRLCVALVVSIAEDREDAKKGFRLMTNAMKANFDRLLTD